jgi:hypothetical protein
MLGLHLDPTRAWDIAKIAITAIAGIVSGSLIERFKRRNSENVRVAAYLRVIASSLSSMAKEFEAAKIPYEDGHVVEALIPSFNDRTKRVVGEDRMALLKKLVSLIDLAKLSDGWIDHPGPEDSGLLLQCIRDAKRLAGELNGLAAKVDSR